MASGPTPTRDFIVWGQALFRIKPQVANKFNKNSLRLLFAISDEQKQWLGWYYFGGSKSVDYVLMADAAGVDYEVIGRFSGGGMPLRTKKPMTVEELAGPILWSERNKWEVPEMGGPGFRRAFLWMPEHDPPNRPVIHIHMTLNHDTAQYRFPIEVKKSKKFHGAGLSSTFSESGFLNFIMMERYKYPTPYLNRASRLKAMERVLTTS